MAGIDILMLPSLPIVSGLAIPKFLRGDNTENEWLSS